MNNKTGTKELILRVLFFSALFTLFSFVFKSEETATGNILRGIFVGTVFAVGMYFFDKWQRRDRTGK